MSNRGSEIVKSHVLVIPETGLCGPITVLARRSQLKAAVNLAAKTEGAFVVSCEACARLGTPEGYFVARYCE